MNDSAIRLKELGKMYKLFRHPADRVFDAFGLRRRPFGPKLVFQEFWALRGIDLRVTKGERIGIIGQNGAGKSTLLKIVTGVAAPTEGSVEVSGQIQALLELGTGFHPEFTGRENIRASLSLNEFSSSEIREMEEDIVDFAELGDFIDHPLKTYSAGMAARLAFSTASAIRPEILIIDEVLGAGDAYFAGKCVERMKQLTHESGATVLFVSHDLNSVQALCERVLWIHRGQVHRDGAPLDTIQDYMAMVRRDEETRLRARDLRVLKKQALFLERDEDVYEKTLFHFVCPGSPPPPPGQRIYGLTLSVDEQEAARIAVGSPMDNSADHMNYLMDTPGYMDWGPAAKDRNSRPYREYGDYKGRYGHAPFEFAVPRTLLREGETQRLQLDIEASVTHEGIAVEAYNGEAYVPIGPVATGEGVATRLEFSSALLRPGKQALGAAAPSGETALLSAAERPAEHAPQQPVRHEYGAGGAKILQVRMLNAQGEDTRVFHPDEPMRVEIEFQAEAELADPVFVFCAYLPDGRCATQWIVDSRTMGSPRVPPGKGRATFRIDRLVLGKSAYVASAAIFKFLRPDGREPESYHVLDRCIHFQVVQGVEHVYEKGLCVQPFEAEIDLGR
ncbi:ABC transporter ATP-binding protein [Candidatus Sumerlaeota bacterium]|nr:ABC transporter ATP-binding protein [Candidatus Sumerlaeota bacterium]